MSDVVPVTTPEGWLAELVTATAALAGALADGDPAARVPACPAWSLADLGRHTGAVHAWAAEAVRTGEAPGDRHEPAEPPDREVAAWYADQAATLLTVLRAADPAAPCWTFGPRPRAAGFWFRRQAHEAAIHAWDAAAAVGRPTAITPALALDGIDEVVTMFFPRQVRLGRTEPLPVALALAPVEGGRWVLTGDGSTGPQGPDERDADQRDADATLRGRAADVLLLLWGRAALDDGRLDVTGDPSAVRTALGHALVP